MKKLTNILLTGHGEANMEALHRLVGQFANAKALARTLEGTVAGSWVDTSFKADVLIHFLGDAPEAELETLGRLAPKDRPATLIVYDRGVANVALMRLAMQAGARDFIMGSQVIDDTLAALRKILKEERFNGTSTDRVLTAVVNAKGGAGASTIACALAHALANRQDLRTLLMDLDFQFGSQSLKLDAHPEQGIMEALSSVESLDEIALMGYVAQHPSGLHVLGSSMGELILPGEVKTASLNQLTQLVQQHYEHTVVDLPRLVDPVFNLVMEKADHAIVVLQQDISSLRDAQRLVQIMTSDLDIPADRILPLVNRYEPYIAIGLADVERTLGLRSAVMVPNDFRHVHTAENLGVPLAEYAPKSPATLAIRKLAETLAGRKAPERPGMFKRLLTKLWPTEKG